jgi:hypothetical protein
MRKKIPIFVYSIAFFVAIVGILYYFKPLSFTASWTPQSFKVTSENPIYAYWADWLKVFTVLLAAVGIWFGATSQNTIRMMKPPLIMFAFAATFVTIGYTIGAYYRSFVGYELSSLSFDTMISALSIPCLIVGSFLAIARAKAPLTQNKKNMFWVVSIIAATLAFVMMILPTLQSSDSLDLKLIVVSFEVGLLVAFIGAFRVLVTFWGAIIGADWFWMSLGFMLLILHFAYLFIPNAPNIDVFSYVNLLWIGGFLLSSFGGFLQAFPAFD